MILRATYRISNSLKCPLPMTLPVRTFSSISTTEESRLLRLSYTSKTLRQFIVQVAA